MYASLPVAKPLRIQDKYCIVHALPAFASCDPKWIEFRKRLAALFNPIVMLYLA